ncbi:MAG: T9SS type A sorting domain-containing protein [Crocinitomicaceae bacterium]|nr:T9SS type A sorting domain-containing protein [Crocinitomicaceae bacterium]
MENIKEVPKTTKGLVVYFLWIILFGMSFSSFSVAQSTVSFTMSHGGMTRKYNLYIPASYNPTVAVPLVLNLHGYTSNKEQQQEYTKFDKVADTANIIVCYPDATPDPIAQQLCWNFGIYGFATNDVDFLEKMVDKIAQDYSIDLARVYGCGISAGATMCYYMACHSDLFTAIGSVAGAMSHNLYNSCVPTYPMPVIDFRGTDDTVGSWDGDINTQGIEDIIQFWVNKNQCTTTPVVTFPPDINTLDGAYAEHMLYDEGINNHTVEFFKIHGGGHTWPKGTVNVMGVEVPYPNGNTCMDVDATAEIWRFFSQYPTSSETASVEANEINAISIYPNPTSSSVQIVLPKQEKSSYAILDLNGKALVKGYLNEIYNVIDVSFLPSGCYFIKTVYGTEKLMIQP